jgi:hypothetical protein
VALAALTAAVLAVRLLSPGIPDGGLSAEPPVTPPMFIAERAYTKEGGYSYVYSDGKYLYDNNFTRLPKLSPSGLGRIEIDIETPAYGDYDTYAGSYTIDPMRVEGAGFQYDIPYNFYGAQQDVALYIALMLGAGFEVESLYETKDSAILELSFAEEKVRVVVGRNRLRVYSKMIGADEFG